MLRARNKDPGQGQEGAEEGKQGPRDEGRGIKCNEIFLRRLSWHKAVYLYYQNNKRRRTGKTKERGQRQQNNVFILEKIWAHAGEPGKQKMKGKNMQTAREADRNTAGNTVQSQNMQITAVMIRICRLVHVHGPAFQDVVKTQRVLETCNQTLEHLPTLEVFTSFYSMSRLLSALATTFRMSPALLDQCQNGFISMPNTVSSHDLL